MGTDLIPLRIDTKPRDRRGRDLRDLRISVLDRCNFRCPYCMPEDAYPRDHVFLSRRDRLRFEEIERIVRVFVSLGVRKLRLTGGEPLLRRDLPDLVRQLAAIDGVEDLALTTNGSLLAGQVQALRDAGLHRLTISLDTLDPDRFRELTGGRGDIAAIHAGIAAAERAGFGSIKFNCVVMRGGNEADVLDLVEHFRGSGHVLRFIEYMDVGTCNAWQRGRVVPGAELRGRISARWPLVAQPARHPSDVAKRWAFADGGGEVGFIDSVSAPFCGDCTRARLSADGKLYTCLFAGHGHDLRRALREGVDDAGMATLIRNVWNARDDRYSELRGSQSGPREHVEMYEIGG